MNGGLTAQPHLPRQVPIEGYGQGGFAFAGMSHRGSLLCLPSGLWPWPVMTAADIDLDALEPVFREADQIDLLLIGAGREGYAAPAQLQLKCRLLGINLEVSRTGTMVSTYNILVEEGRTVAAALIAVA